MIIGKFSYNANKDVYTGDIYSNVIPNKLTIEPNTSSTSERAPDYRLLADGREIGAGWKRSSRDRGTSFVSIHIDDPALPAPIEAVLSETGDLVWNRPRVTAAPKQSRPTPG